MREQKRLDEKTIAELFVRDLGILHIRENQPDELQKDTTSAAYVDANEPSHLLSREIETCILPAIPRSHFYADVSNRQKVRPLFVLLPTHC